MAPNRFQRFSRHATPHLKASRHMWTLVERMNTIVTVYHGDPTVKQHYSTSNGEIPTLSTLFPNVAYTEANVIEARSHGMLPGALASVQTPPVPLSMYARYAVPTAPAWHSEPVQTPIAAVSAAPAYINTPYEFWPPLPWPYEPDLPTVGAGTMSMENKDTFMNTKPHMSDEETRWQGAKFIGSGSSGAAGLWCKIDEQGNVVDRMVVKDNVAFPRDAWRDPKNWRDRLPKETAIHRRIESRRSAETEACRHIVKYRGHRLSMSKRRYRLYTDYASGGDLQVAMNKSYHEKWYGINRKDASTQECVPEAFIWHTIKALATASLILQHGTTGDEPVEDWRSIVHLDFQLPNVLLDIQNTKRKRLSEDAADSSPAGPSKRFRSTERAAVGASRPHGSVEREDRKLVPVLTDFGLSTFDLDFDHCQALNENPLDHTLPVHILNTQYAPEHQDQNPEDIQPLDEKTNVWGIGRIAWGLIVNQVESQGPVREGGPVDIITGDSVALSRCVPYNMGINDFYDREVLIGSKEWPAASRYSEPLKALVRDCLRFWKDYRPTPREVLDRVSEYLLASPQLAVGGMDVGKAGLVLPDDDGSRVGDVLVGVGLMQ